MSCLIAGGLLALSGCSVEISAPRIETTDQEDATASEGSAPEDGGARLSDPCDDIERIVDGWQQTPDSSGGEPLHSVARMDEVVADVDNQFTPLLIRDGDASGFESFINEVSSLRNAVASQHDPDVEDVLVAHGFIRGAARGFADDHGIMIKHAITHLSSPANAESFLVSRARYSCIFTEEVWSVNVTGGDAQRPSSRTAVGQQIRHDNDVFADQVSWTRGSRRHSLTIFWATNPDRSLLEDLTERVAPLDTGEELDLE